MLTEVYRAIALLFPFSVSCNLWLVMAKGGIFEAGFGEILRPPHLQWAGKRKFALRFIKPGVTDPMLGNVTDISSRQK